MNQLEEGTKLTIDFGKLQKIADTRQAVVPVVLQHADTREVLFIGYANELALQETIKIKQAVLWSTSRNELWRKGETSGDVLDLVEIWVNCEQNSLLYCVRPRKGGVCHTKDASGKTREACYYRRLSQGTSELEFV
jgi:phosphoribosyl-AMP cyclohydrolase